MEYCLKLWMGKGSSDIFIATHRPGWRSQSPFISWLPSWDDRENKGSMLGWARSCALCSLTWPTTNKFFLGCEVLTGEQRSTLTESNCLFPMNFPSHASLSSLSFTSLSPWGEDYSKKHCFLQARWLWPQPWESHRLISPTFPIFWWDLISL